MYLKKSAASGSNSLYTHLLPLIIHGDLELVIQERPVGSGAVTGGHLPTGVQGPATFQQESPVRRVPRHDVGWDLSPTNTIVAVRREGGEGRYTYQSNITKGRTHSLHAVVIRPSDTRPREEEALFPSGQFTITICTSYGGGGGGGASPEIQKSMRTGT